MKKMFVAFAGLACLTVFTACNNETAPDDAVVTINGTDITEAEFVESLKDQAGDQNLLSMIQLQLLKEKADDIGITDEELEAEIEELKTNFGVEEDEDLFNTITAQTQGQIEVDSRDELIDDYIKPQLVITKLSAEGVEVTEEDKEAFYEENQDSFGTQVQARHILVEDIETAEDLEAQLEDGADFAELAEENSTDPGSAANGGELPLFGEGEMVPEFEEAAFSLDIDEISEPIESTHGFHIIQVMDRLDSYEDFADEIEEILIGQQSKDPNQVFSELLSDADINFEDSRYEDLLAPYEQVEEGSEEEEEAQG
ncbi:peptidylprolyl isomerase [Alkalicoccobacillus murimartini]|uniref:Foldase protein PrsA n=1 Tax=Alkalicoccobacillus murimartini TaxID=171685 RepID=A0ABT9YBU5_9BACI|nr:peptidylprolyl isomerase [Alkalicoccobacillus murimartini]MDQ0205310.1 peptidylprolyl isomerase/foldase protein PrsA [Alkalicoccobacillus murimartini]